jgi:hypothetical protein
VDPTVFRSAAIRSLDRTRAAPGFDRRKAEPRADLQTERSLLVGGLAGAGVTGIEQSMIDVVVAGAIGGEAVIRMRWKLSDCACDRTRRRNSSASGPASQRTPPAIWGFEASRISTVRGLAMSQFHGPLSGGAAANERGTLIAIKRPRREIIPHPHTDKRPKRSQRGCNRLRQMSIFS